MIQGTKGDSPDKRQRTAIGDGSPALSVDTRGLGNFLGGVGGWLGGLLGGNAVNGAQAAQENKLAEAQSRAMAAHKNYAVGGPDVSKINAARSGYPNPGGMNWAQNGTTQSPLAPVAGFDGGGGGSFDAPKTTTTTTAHVTPTPAPQPVLQMPAAPIFTAPNQDYNSYLAQAQKELNFGAIAQPYEQAINQVGTETGIAVGNIGAAAHGAQQDIQGGSALLQQAGQQGSANNAAVESALSQQLQGAAGAGAAGTNALAATLGMGAQGVDPALAQQTVAAQQALGASAQDNQRAVNDATQSQVAANQNYGKVVDAKSTMDQQNAQLAGQDAKVGIGMQKGSALTQARETAASNAMTMEQNAIANALAKFGTEASIYGTQSNNVYNMGQLGLTKYADENNVAYQNNSLAAQVAGAKAANLQAAYAPLFNAINNGFKYNQVNSPLMGQELGSAEQLSQALLGTYGQQGYSPTISQGLLNGSQDSAIAPTLNDVLTTNGQTTKKKR